MLKCPLHRWYNCLLSNRKITTVFGTKYVENRLYLYPHTKNIFDFELIEVFCTKTGFNGGHYGNFLARVDDKKDYKFSNYDSAKKHLESIVDRTPFKTNLNKKDDDDQKPFI